MLTNIVDGIRKLRENDAFPALLRPRVVANYLQHLKERRERPVVMTSHPTAIEIELTNRCNLACVQCLRSRGLRPYALGDIDRQGYERVLAQFPHAMNLSLNGFGEALLHQQFFEIVGYSRAQLPWAKIGIYSNGMLLDDDRAERLPSCGLTEVNVSIDAALPGTYRKIRRGGELKVVHDNIGRVIRARRLARKKHPLLGLNFVMLNDNAGELVRFVEQAAELEVDFINCITLATYDWGFTNRRSQESYRRELDLARQRMQALGVRCRSFPSDFSWAEGGASFDCSLFWGDNFRVTYSGHITLGCCTPFKETFSYGNVLETPFREIWNNASFQRNRQLAKQGMPPVSACASCHQFQRRFFES